MRSKNKTLQCWPLCSVSLGVDTGGQALISRDAPVCNNENIHERSSFLRYLASNFVIIDSDVLKFVILTTIYSFCNHFRAKRF